MSEKISNIFQREVGLSLSDRGQHSAKAKTDPQRTCEKKFRWFVFIGHWL